jgi:hypothetical protein
MRPNCSFDDYENHKKINELTFWQRRPEDGLDWKFARKIANDLRVDLHVHNAPDIVSASFRIPPKGVHVTNSGESNLEYLRAVKDAQYFLSPRFTEGIGMSLVEAISFGTVPLVFDYPTGNEYIEDMVDGLMIGKSVNELENNRHKLIHLRENYLLYRKNLIEKSHEGYTAWIDFSKKIVHLVNTAPVPDLSKEYTDFSIRYLDLTRYYRGDPAKFYRKIKDISHIDAAYSEYSSLDLKHIILLLLPYFLVRNKLLKAFAKYSLRMVSIMKNIIR